jgi:hypothetical protein
VKICLLDQEVGFFPQARGWRSVMRVNLKPYRLADALVVKTLSATPNRTSRWPMAGSRNRTRAPRAISVFCVAQNVLSERGRRGKLPHSISFRLCLLLSSRS